MAVGGAATIATALAARSEEALPPFGRQTLERRTRGPERSIGNIGRIAVQLAVAERDTYCTRRRCGRSQIRGGDIDPIHRRWLDDQ